MQLLLLFINTNLPSLATLIIVITVALSFFAQTANGLACYNYTSTLSNILPQDAPILTGCRSCSRGVFSAQWPSAPIDGQPAVYTWSCSNLAVHLPSNTAVTYNDYPTDEECAMGSYELASPSAGYLALCTCCRDFCNGALTCKTYNPNDADGDGSSSSSVMMLLNNNDNNDATNTHLYSKSGIIYYCSSISINVTSFYGQLASLLTSSILFIIFIQVRFS